MTDLFDEFLIAPQGNREQREAITFESPEDYLQKTATACFSLVGDKAAIETGFSQFLSSLRATKVTDSSTKTHFVRGQIENHFWKMGARSLYNVQIFSIHYILEQLKAGESFVLPKQIQNNPYLDYTDPLILNATRRGNQLYVYLYDKQDAYLHQNDLLPDMEEQPHWYDYVLDFLAKIFGGRRGICQGWDSYYGNNQKRSYENLHQLHYLLENASRKSTFVESSPSIPFKSLEENEAYLTDLFAHNSSGKLTGYSQIQPLQMGEKEEESLIPEEKAKDTSKDRKEKNVLGYFQSKDHITETTKPWIISKKTRKKQMELNKLIHNLSLPLLNRTAYIHDLKLYTYRENVSLCACFRMALFYGLAETHPIPKDMLTAAIRGKTAALPMDFKNSCSYLLQNPRSPEIATIINRGLANMENELLLQKGLLSPWSLQIVNALNLCDSALQEQKSRAELPSKNKKYHRQDKLRDFEYSPDPKNQPLLELYKKIQIAEDLFLEPKKPLSADSIICICQGQLAYSFLEQISRQPPNERKTFMEKIWNNTNSLKKACVVS
ncbi:MAG: hypothetical protein Q4B50_00250 [Bacillota bacterium]|nr:hypothetical protein [Bacillota bacterium]